MVVNNKIKEALFEYKKLNHENMTKEKIKANLKKIFSKFNIDPSNFFFAEVIIESERKKQRKEYTEQETQEIDEDQLESKPENKKVIKPKTKKRKPAFFNIAEIGDLPVDVAREALSTKLKKLCNYTDEELNQPIDQLNVLGMDDKAMQLNITPGIPLIDQLVELSKKLYIVLISGKKDVKDVRNATLSDLDAIDRNEPTQYSFVAPDGTIVSGSISTDEPDIRVTLNTNGNSGSNVDNEHMLTQQDLAEIKRFNITGIASHVEMEAFRKTDHYRMIKSVLESENQRSL